MCNIVHRSRTAPHHIDNRGVGIDTQVLRNLVVGALNKGAEYRPHGAQPAFCHTGNHRHCLFFGYAHIQILFTGFCPFCGGESTGGGSACRYGNQALVVLHLAEHPIAEQLLIGLLRRCCRTLPVCSVKGCAVVPSLFVLYRGRKTVSFLGVDMHYRRSGGIFHAAKYIYQFCYVVTLFQIYILKSPRLKPVVRTSPAAFAQGTQVLVDTAVILRDRHLIVVHHNNYARTKFRCLVQSLKSLAARERTIANDGNDVFVATMNIAGFLQTGGKRDRCGGVSHLEIVIYGTLVGRRVAADGVHGISIAQETGSATGQHFVRVALVADIEHQFVFGRIKYIVQCHGGFHKTEVRTYMPSVHTHTTQNSTANLIGNHIQGGNVQFL